MRWEIKIINQAPITVDVDESRNLATEFTEFKTRPRTFWEWVRRAERYWQVTETVSLHPETVVMIKLLTPRRSSKRAVIGFQVPHTE